LSEHVLVSVPAGLGMPESVASLPGTKQPVTVVHLGSH
jgi:hypothetical protein